MPYTVFSDNVLGGADTATAASAPSTALYDRADILRPERVRDGALGSSVSWREVESDLPCQVEKAGAYKESEAGDRVESSASFRIRFAAGADVRPADRVRTDSGGVFEVVGTDHGLSSASFLVVAARLRH